MPIPHPLPGAVLLGHGSREPGTLAEIIALESELASTAPDWHFTHAFLNQEPGLEAAVEKLAKARCTLIRVIPLLVFTGKHILEDIPAEIERLRALYPFFDFELEPHLSRLPGFTGILLDALSIDKGS